MSELRTDEEIRDFIANLPGGLPEFREMVSTGRLAGRRGERGKQYLARLGAADSDNRAERQTVATERQAASSERSNLIAWIALAVSVVALAVAIFK